MSKKWKEIALRVLIAIPLYGLGFLALYKAPLWCWVLYVGVIGVSVASEVFWRLNTSVNTYKAYPHCVGLLISAFISVSVLVQLGTNDKGRAIIALVAITVMVFDTMSMLSGWIWPSKWNKQITPKESKGKTWAGFIGGVVFTLVLGTFLYRYIDSNHTGLPSSLWFFVTLSVIPIVAFIGDLNESMAKRRLYRYVRNPNMPSWPMLDQGGIKDFSRSLGPHGGFSDRFDAMFMVFTVLGPFWLWMI